jgi:hypothetical protein
LLNAFSAGTADTTSGSCSGANEDVHLDSAISLCTIASKQVMTAAAANASAIAVSNDVASVVTTAFTQSQKLLSACVCTCDTSVLSSATHLLNSVDLVLSVFARVDGPISAHTSAATAVSTSVNKQSNPQQQLVSNVASSASFQVNDKQYSRDGLLLTTAVLAPLIKFTLKESQRRDVQVSTHKKPIQTPTPLTTQQQSTVDVDELVAVLQRSENHLLATRVLLSAHTPHTAGATKAQTMRASLFALTRKLLTYVFIDSHYVIAILGLLPFEAMVKELKTVIPNIQTDYKRLKIVASIGEELAQMWNEVSA